MFRLFYALIKDYGAFGIGIVQLLIICYFGWKLFTNHLHHLGIKIDSVCKGLENVESELEKEKKATNRLGNRISTIEGQLIEKNRVIVTKKVLKPKRKKK